MSEKTRQKVLSVLKTLNIYKDVTITPSTDNTIIKIENKNVFIADFEFKWVGNTFEVFMFGTKDGVTKDAMGDYPLLSIKNGVEAAGFVSVVYSFFVVNRMKKADFLADYANQGE